MPVKFQNDRIIITPNLTASGLTRFGGKTSYRLVNRGPGPIWLRLNTSLYTITAKDAGNNIWAAFSFSVLDQVSASYEPLQQVNRATLAKVLLLVAMTWYGGDHMLLLHKEGTMTLLKGRCAAFGLGELICT